MKIFRKNLLEILFVKANLEENGRISLKDRKIKKRLKEIIWIFEVYLNFVLGRSNHLSIYHISFVNS